MNDQLDDIEQANQIGLSLAAGKLTNLRTLQSIHTQALNDEIKWNEHVMSMAHSNVELREKILELNAKAWSHKRYRKRIKALDRKIRKAEKRFATIRRHIDNIERLIGTPSKNRIQNGWKSLAVLAAGQTTPIIQRKIPSTWAYYMRALGSQPTLEQMQSISKILEVIDAKYQPEIEQIEQKIALLQERSDALEEKNWGKAGIV